MQNVVVGRHAGDAGRHGARPSKRQWRCLVRFTTVWPATCVVILMLAACGGSGSSATPTATVSPGSGLQMSLASSELVMGNNRFTFGVRYHNHPITFQPNPRLAFIRLNGTQGTVEQAQIAKFSNLWTGLPNPPARGDTTTIRGVYVTHANFPEAGTWGVQVQVRFKGRNVDLQQVFSVAQHGSTPAVGSRAPRSNNPTISQQPVSKLDSGRPPDDMHRLSIAGAIAQHKPLLVLFSTPAFCVSQMCGPQTQVVEQLEPRYRGAINFVHIEIYKDANPSHGYAPTVTQWHLQTEPWIFVINRRGIITAKFEGPTGSSEIESALHTAVQSSA